MSHTTVWDEKSLETIYNHIKKVQKGELDRNTGIQKSIELTGGNRSSIAYQFAAFENMIEGKCFTMTINTTNCEVFLRHIESEFTMVQVTNALTSLKGHLVLRNDWGKNGRKEILVRHYARRNGVDVDRL